MRHIEMTKDYTYIGETQLLAEEKTKKKVLSVLERNKSSNIFYFLSDGDGNDNNSSNK